MIKRGGDEHIIHRDDLWHAYLSTDIGKPVVVGLGVMILVKLQGRSDAL